jgi:hypothetical protein
MRLPSVKVLMIANLLVLGCLALWAVDIYVRWRAAGAVASYHQQVIQPLITPRPPPMGGSSEKK